MVAVTVEAVATAVEATWVEEGATSAVVDLISAEGAVTIAAADISVAATLAQHLRVVFDPEAVALESRMVEEGPSIMPRRSGVLPQADIRCLAR